MFRTDEAVPRRSRTTWLHRLSARTAPSHGAKRGSIPLGATNITTPTTRRGGFVLWYNTSNEYEKYNLAGLNTCNRRGAYSGIDNRRRIYLDANSITSEC